MKPFFILMVFYFAALTLCIEELGVEDEDVPTLIPTDNPEDTGTDELESEETEAEEFETTELGTEEFETKEITTAEIVSMGNCEDVDTGTPEDSYAIAVKAAMDAKAAEGAQNEAAKEAAYRVREELADKAEEAAKAAKADLAGKEALVKQFQRELREARTMETSARLSLEQFEDAISSSKRTFRMANSQIERIESILKAARNQVTDAQGILANLEEMLSDKEQLLEGMSSCNAKNDETLNLQELQDTVASARKCVSDAEGQVSELESALELAQNEAVAAQETVDSNDGLLKDKQMEVDYASCRVSRLLQKLNSAKSDFEETKISVESAEAAAQEAQYNVGRAKRKISKRSLRY